MLYLTFYQNLNAVSVFSQKSAFGAPTVVYELLESGDIKNNQLDDPQTAQTCSFVDQKFSPDCSNWTSTVSAQRDQQLEWRNLMVNRENSECFLGILIRMFIA